MIRNHEKGFVLVFVMAVVAALSIMTSAMYFYYQNDLKSVSRNSVMQQVTLAAETGLQEGQRWISDQLNANTFGIVDIKNSSHIVDSNNKCLNRHGYTNDKQDVYYAKRIEENLGTDDIKDVKFENISYEVFIQRQADLVRSIYFSEQGSKNSEDQDTIFFDRSFAVVERFKDFPTEQFTIEMWIKNKQQDSSYDMHLFEWGREWDLEFKVTNDAWLPKLGENELNNEKPVGNPIKDKWVHIAWVWDGGDPLETDSGNIKFYQNGTLKGIFSANILEREKAGVKNRPEVLPEGNNWPFVIGEGLQGFSSSSFVSSTNSYIPSNAIINSTPWLGNVAEMRIWNVSRTASEIANNRRKRLTGSETGLVSYYKFDEGTGKIANDSNSTRSSADANHATIYGIGSVGTSWANDKEYYTLTSTDNIAPELKAPPAEGLVFYEILSCGNGPQGQIVPLKMIVSAPIPEGDVGDGEVALTSQNLNPLTGQDGSPLSISLASMVGRADVAGDITIQESDIENTNFYAFKRSMEQCNNATEFTEFEDNKQYIEQDCVEFNGKLWMLEKDNGKSSGTGFVKEEWTEVLGSGCEGVQFKSSAKDQSYGHYYKYFSTAPNVTSDLGYNRDSIDWWEAKRRAEQSTCGGMRGYLVSIETTAENEFIKNAVMCDSSSASGCTGVIPFHVAAGETRTNYYGSRLGSSNDQHYVWLSNSDWRNRGTMASESGPNMGASLSFTQWQSGEPNGGRGGEDYTDMEINRSGRSNGGWNDLRRIPNCNSNGLDCITGYVVEYGGFDSFELDHDNLDNNKDIDDDTNICTVKATIEKDKYVKGEDFLKYDNTSNGILDGSPDVIPSTDFDSNTSDEWPGWDELNGSLTLKHKNKPPNWSHLLTYPPNYKVWYNNRVWKNSSGRNIIGGANLKTSETPTIYNPYVWKLYSGNEPDAPCDDKKFWVQAFEAIKYYNKLAIDPENSTNPYFEGKEPPSESEDDDSDDAKDEPLQEDDVNTATLGERVIIFSLGPLHVHKHLDGYNHFYEFYKFPEGSGTQTLYNDNNRRMNESFALSNQLHYFGKTGYLVTITSEEENDIITEEAIGNSGWLGSLAQNTNQNSNNNLDECGGIRKRGAKQVGLDRVTGRYLARKDFQALGKLEDSTIWKWYTGGTHNSGTLDDPEYLRKITPQYDTQESKIIKDISATDNTNATIVETVESHGLRDDDIIKLTDRENTDPGGDDIDMNGIILEDYYRVVVLDNKKFELVDLNSRKHVNTLNSQYDNNSAELIELEGIRNEYFRSVQAGKVPEMFWKDPKINHSDANDNNTTQDNDCSVWRWITGPEQFLHKRRGLAFAPNRKYTDNPSANQNGDDNGENIKWTRKSPSGQQVGEKFKDGMPFRYWAPNEPNNLRNREPGLFMMGLQSGASQEFHWKDLYNWNAPHSATFSVKGINVEYGGLENDGDPILRIATKRIIKLKDRRVRKAIVKILPNGLKSGDKLVVDSNNLSKVGLSATGNSSEEIIFTGIGSCKTYMDAIKSTVFNHTGIEGTRKILVEIGDVIKPPGSEFYYANVSGGGDKSYQQADFQASFRNLCGLQGYLANVTTAQDLSSIVALGVESGKEAWVNGTAECQNGIYRQGFWRYTSGPWRDKEFWRLRINSNASIDDPIECPITSLRSSEPSVRVGPFESTNWLSSHPAADNNDFLTFQQSSGKIKTRAGLSDPIVNSYIVKFGGSGDDFTGADIDEVNDVTVIEGPLRAEITFYSDGSDNSIFIDNEDKLKIETTGDEALSSRWNITQSYSSISSPLIINPPTDQLVKIADWRRELAKVYYKNIDTKNYTPGNRKIKITLLYSTPSLNTTIGIIKSIGSKNKVVVQPISWNNR